MKGKPGTGKGTFARTFGKIFGRHFVHLDRTEQLAGKFNALISGKVVVFADEAFFAGNKQELGSLKRLISEPTLTIERKGIDPTTEGNFMHLLMATNEAWVVPAGEHERRYMVVNVSDHRMQDLDYFNAINQQMRDPENLSALLTYLMTLPTSHDAVRRVPRTDELRVQQELTLPAEMKWWREKLWEGAWGAEGTWPEDLPVQTIFDDYIAWCDQQKINRRQPQTILMRDHLNLWFGPRRRFGSGFVRPLLPLDKARAAWDAKYGVSTPWPIDPSNDPPQPDGPSTNNDGRMPF